jgi:hypothetical protein
MVVWCDSNQARVHRAHYYLALLLKVVAAGRSRPRTHPVITHSLINVMIGWCDRLGCKQDYALVREAHSAP